VAKRFVLKRKRVVFDESILRDSLNEEQFAAATAPFCPVLIIAGAGTGKTHTLTYRVVYLLSKGLSAPRIVLATFTNRAARDMLARVRQIVGAEAELITGGTFHHIGNRILRRYAQTVGLPNNYTILDAEDSVSLVGQCRSEAGIKMSEKKFPMKKVLQNIYSDAVNRLRSIEETVTEKFPDFLEHLETIEEIWMRYKKKKRELAVMDYDDLLVYLLEILESDGREAKAIKSMFDVLLVDEYQDTNALQGRLVDLLASEHRNLTVVGDDAQSIYSFRGAEFHNIITFPERYPDCKTYYLKTNYRSTPQILDLANASIAHNIRQFKKELRPVRKDYVKPALICCEDVFEQAAVVAEKVLSLREEGLPLSDIGVLYRSHWNAMELQLELARRRIPFEVRSGLRFFERAHIKDSCAFLRIVANPRDELAWRRVLPLFSGIGTRTASKIYRILQEEKEPLRALNTDRLRKQLPKRVLAGLNDFVTLVSSINDKEVVRNPGEALRRVLKNGYENILESKYPDWRSRRDDILQMSNYAETFDIEEFLSHLAISTSLVAETTVFGESEEEEGVLTLSTVHRAKGLEWRVVFLLWCAEGALPSAPSLQEGEEAIEEERRVFYVACTRAKELLLLLYPRLRSQSRRWQVPPDESIFQKPSRFITELPEEVYEEFTVEEEF